MIAIVDYGVGNLFSLSNSFAAIGEEAFVSSDPGMIQSADKIVLPGVGAFSDAADKLRESGLDKLVLEETKKGKKLLGICLGMQLLFEESFEYGRHRGLGLLEGQIKAISDFASASYKIPHMGWNALTLTSPKHELFKYINEGDCAYFVHSYCAVNCEGSIIASAEYGCNITAAAAKGNIMGCQFHPEKSGDVGLKILKAFSEMK